MCTLWIYIGEVFNSRPGVCDYIYSLPPLLHGLYMHIFNANLNSPPPTHTHRNPLSLDSGAPRKRPIRPGIGSFFLLLIFFFPCKPYLHLNVSMGSFMFEFRIPISKILYFKMFACMRYSFPFFSFFNKNYRYCGLRNTIRILL